MTTKKAKDSGPQQDPAMVIAFLLDETGSMSSVRDATISGFNEYIVTVSQKYPQALLSLRLFSTEKYDKVTQLTPLAHAPHLSHDSYKPSGGTPLYDCVARLVREVEADTQSFDPAPEVLFVIMTDGEENSSREFSREKIFTLINAKTEMGWTFVYLGANQDAWQVGRSIGVPVSGSMTYDANSLEIPTMLRKMSQATTRHMDEKMHMRRENPSAAPQSREFFTEEDATDLGKKRPPSDN